VLFIQTLGQLEALGVPLAYVGFHLIVVVGEERVLHVLSEHLTLDQIGSVDQFVEGLEISLNFLKLGVFSELLLAEEGFTALELVDLIVSIHEVLAELVGFAHVLLDLREAAESDDVIVEFLVLKHVLVELSLLVLQLGLHDFFLLIHDLLALGNAKLNLSRLDFLFHGDFDVFFLVGEEVLVQHKVMLFNVLVEGNKHRLGLILGLVDEGA